MVRGPEQLERGFATSLEMGAVLVAAEADPGPTFPGRGAGRGGGEGQAAEHTEKTKKATVPE
jgi:hypothetical protein